MTASITPDMANEIHALISALARKDPVARQQARESLVALGSRQVTAALVEELTDPRENVRWEAAKALSAVADPVSAPALVHALADDNEGVRWLAAEGLINLGKTGLLAVLSELIKRAGWPTYCQSAHHVLTSCARKGDSRILAPVIAALDAPERGVSVPPAAYRALVALKVGDSVETL